MAITDPIYIINGIEATRSTIAEIAKGHNMSADEYITKFKGVLVQGKTTDSTTTNPNVGSGNTGLNGVDGSSDYEDRASGIKPTNSWDSESNVVKNYNYYKRNPREQRPNESEIDFKVRVNETLPNFGDSLNDPNMTSYQKADALQGYTITESGTQRSTASKYKFEDGKLTNEVDNEYGIDDVQRAKKIIVDEDLDIPYENLHYNQSKDNNFVNAYFNSIELDALGVNPTDFQGWMNKNGFSEDFEQDMLDGVYNFEGNNEGGSYYTDSDKKDLAVNKERKLNSMLTSYMNRQDERYNRKIVLDGILDGKKGVTLDNLNDKKYTQFDGASYKNYTNTNFPELSKKDEENRLAKVAKAERRKNRQENQDYLGKKLGPVGGVVNWVWDAVEGGGNFVGNIPGGLWGGITETSTWIEDMVGMDVSAKRKRGLNWESEESDDGLNYFYVQGQGVELNGQKYIRDANGGIYNVTSGYSANGVLSEKQFLELNKKIDDEGVAMDDYNFIAGAKQMGDVTGNILFQVLGQKGIGAARGAVATRIGAAANGYKSVSKYKKMITLKRGLDAGVGYKPKNIFQAIKPEMVDAAMFQSLYGASIGYENTISAAKKAGLSDLNAEDLANSAMQEMGVLYALTGPINPRIPLVKSMDKWIKGSGAIDDLIKNYTKTGSVKAASTGFKQKLLNFKSKAASFGLTFAEAGSKEFVQENIQQKGEFEIVNARTNEVAGFDLMKSKYTEQDFINTSILSFAAGGLLGGASNFKNGFKQDPYKRLQNLMHVGGDIAGSKARLNKMVLEGKATAEQVDAILFEAEAAITHVNKMPPWLISRNPEAYIKAAKISKEIEKLESDKKAYVGSFTAGLDERIEKKKAELNTVTEEAAAKLVLDEATTIEKILDSKKTKITDGISQKGKSAKRVETFKTTAELLAADPSANPDADAYFNEKTGQIVINLEVAAKTQAVSAASHELLHKILKAEFSSNPEMLKIVEEFKAILAKTDSIYKGKSVLDLINDRLEQNYTAEEIESAPDEWLTAFSDLVAKNEVIFTDLDEKTWLNLGKKIANVLKGKGFSQINFSSGQDVFDFIRDYQENIKKGSVTRSSKNALDKGEKIDGKDNTRESLSSRQDLKWKNTEGDLSAEFKVGERIFKTSLVETAYMEFDEGQTYQDIEDIAKELGITEDKDGYGIESSERYFHYEFGDKELGKDITGTGNAMEVFSVAGNGLIDYLNKKKNIEGVIFTAKEPSRIRLYKTLGQALADKIGGSFAYKNNTFIVSRKPPEATKFSKSSTDFNQELERLVDNEFEMEPGDFEAQKSNLELKIRAAKKKEVSKPKKRTEFDIGEDQVIGQLNALVPKEIKTNKELKENEEVGKAINDALKPNGLIYVQIKDKVGGGDKFRITLERIRRGWLTYDPAAKRKTDSKVPITFGEWVFSNIQFRRLDAEKELAIAAVKRNNQTDLDNKQAQSIANEESSGPTADSRKKYASLISNTKMIPSFVVNEIKTKLVDITSKLTSKLSTRPKGANAQTTPLIAEIKKAIGNVVKDPKALPKQLIDRMGNPKDGSYQTYLIDSKKSILENMTTTYLQTAIPAAVEKSVGGTYVLDNDGKRKKDSNGNDIFKPNFVPYSEWKGKKIDREKVSTNKKGGTSGNEIVRRAIQVENKEGKFEDSISNEDFVANFVGSDGKVIRGKRESLGKALAEEAGFEVLTKELANENSDIRKAFKENQTALKEVLVDNFVEQISRDAERGTVKFSKTAIKLKVVDGIVDGINTQIFTNRFIMHANNPSNDFPLYTSITEHFQEFPIVGLEVGNLRKIATELSKDYTFKPFGEIGIKRVQEAEGVLKTLKYIQENTKEGVTRGNSYATAQLIIQGLDTKLDTKTLLGINEGREAAKKVVDVLAAQGFTGNEIKNIFVAIYSPSGLGGFKGKLKKDGKTRATPNSTVLVEDDLGAVNYKKDKETKMPTSQVEDRGSFMVSVADFEQNFLKGIEMGDKVSTRTDAYTKNFWSKDDSVYNKLDNKGKEEYLQELQKGKIEYQASLIKFIEAVNKASISPAAQRTLIRSPFAAMDGLGKITSAPRWMPAKLDGTLLSLKDLVKLGFGRKDGKIDKGVFEHTKPANRMAIAAYIYSMTGKKADLDILMEELSDFDTAFITEGMDKSLVRNKLQSLMGLNYVRGAGVMTTRYAEMIQEMNKAGVTFYDAKTNTLLSPAGALGAQLNQEMKANLEPVNKAQKAVNNARSNKYSKSPKKIRVFDFDDTLARTKSNVLYTMPDGTTGKIDAATFAKDAGRMEAEGAQWDFSEFSKVMNGQAGPLLEVAKIIADKRGTKDVFVLTARPADAAGPIQEFLASMGLNIPIENITGLGNGTPKAKADWVVGKVADGYNDFYFADDHTGNVKAVKDALDTFDVKGKVQLAKVKFSKGLDTKFNDMIQRQKGVESFKEFSKATAQRRGKKVGKWKFFISPSAEDFRGLTQYKFAGKGRQGEADQKFFEESLMDPYFQGVAALESARQAIKEDTKALLRMFKPVKKKLNKLIPNEQYTYDAAVRVYLWNKAGKEIPGLSKRDNKKLNDLVANDLELSAFADGLLTVSKKDSWPEPKEHWLAQTTLSDLNNLTEKTNRKEYLTEFIENVDIIFSEKNLNKVEALYGEASRKAIENAISAMKSGSNSANQGADAITSKWTQWVNNSIGTIMFFNRRSAILQTLSSANFINWSDNNPAKAALAFANQPQYWKDFAMIFNSDKLKQRRGGLKSDVQEAEIANAAKNTQDKAGAIIAYILKIGFTPTQIADSFAISLGGASLYRNRVKTYTKQGMDLKDAETKAFQDFSKLSDEAQQSGDPALVSQQQRSVAGRLILSFQNTTMQYTRLMKKHGQDLINNRGDKKTHVSAILYFGAVQNFLFNALSQTAFALIPGFDEEEEDDDEKRDEALEAKAAKILNGMSDSVVRGTGIYGAIITTLKNSYLTWERENKKGFTGDQTKTIIELANLSPAIGSKLRKVYSGIQTNQFDKDVIAKHPWSVTIGGKFNPSATYTIIANLSSAAFNLPLDRALTEARGVAEMLDARNSVFQRIALGAGWRTWNVGAKNEEFDLIKAEGKIVRKKEGKEKAKKTRAKNKEKEKQRVDNLSPAERLKEKNAKAKKKRDAALARKMKKQDAAKRIGDSLLQRIRESNRLKNKK